MNPVILGQVLVLEISQGWDNLTVDVNTTQESFLVEEFVVVVEQDWCIVHGREPNHVNTSLRRDVEKSVLEREVETSV